MLREVSSEDLTLYEAYFRFCDEEAAAARAGAPPTTPVATQRMTPDGKPINKVKVGMQAMFGNRVVRKKNKDGSGG